jgi:hypothetical protein
MNALVVPQLKRPTPKLILHCGAQRVELEEVRCVTTPLPTSSWQPIPHDRLISTVQGTLARKHTRFIVRDLPQITERAIGQLMNKWYDQDKRIASYKQSDIADAIAHDLVVRATNVGVCSNRLIQSVLHEWCEPRHEAFQPRNVWSLFNAVAESLKDGDLAELPKRTEALHGLLDTHVGLGLN